MVTIETLIVASALAATYLGAARVTVVRGGFARRWLSAAAGVSVAYVFMDILPELETQHQLFVAAIGENAFFAEQRIYIAALIGFVLFYGFDRFLLRRAAGGDTPAEHNATDAAFWVHVGGYAVYSWLIGYLLIERADLGARVLALYGIAMMLHLTLVSHALVRRHGRAYTRVGAWILAASILGGWATGVMIEMPAVVIARVFAFVAGGIVMTSMNEELPAGQDGNFWWFSGGAAVYALILLATH